MKCPSIVATALMMIGITTTASAQAVTDTSSKYFVLSSGLVTEPETQSLFVFGQALVGEFPSSGESGAGNMGFLYMLGEVPSPISPENSDLISDISPSPVLGDKVTIYLNNQTDSATATITIFDAAGKTVVELSVPSMHVGEVVVDAPLYGLPAGTYYCRTAIDGKIAVKAFDVIR